MEKQFKIYRIGGANCYMIRDETEHATDTGIRFRQEQSGTKVWHKSGVEIKMPKTRYTFADGRGDQAFLNDLQTMGLI